MSADLRVDSATVDAAAAGLRAAGRAAASTQSVTEPDFGSVQVAEAWRITAEIRAARVAALEAAAASTSDDIRVGVLELLAADYNIARGL